MAGEGDYYPTVNVLMQASRCQKTVLDGSFGPSEFCQLWTNRGVSPGSYRVSSLRSCLESLSIRLSLSIMAFGSKPRLALSTWAEMDAESSASSWA